MRVAAWLAAYHDAEVRREDAIIARGIHVEGSCVAAGEGLGPIVGVASEGSAESSLLGFF